MTDQTGEMPRLTCLAFAYSHFCWFCQIMIYLNYSKTCVKRPLSKRPKIGFQGRLSLNAGQKYCRMLPLEHSAVLLTFIKLAFVIKIFVLSVFEWGFTQVLLNLYISS